MEKDNKLPTTDNETKEQKDFITHEDFKKMLSDYLHEIKNMIASEKEVEKKRKIDKELNEGNEEESDYENLDEVVDFKSFVKDVAKEI